MSPISTELTEEQNELEALVCTFKVTDLQMLLEFAGRSKGGTKNVLQARALELVKVRSVPIQAKIRELYRASQVGNRTPKPTVEDSILQYAMMGQGGAPINPYQGMSYAALMGAYGAHGAQQAVQAGRNPYGYAQQQIAPHLQGTHQIPGAGHHGIYGANPTAANPYQMAATRSLPRYPEVKLIKLPFYDVQSELLKPASLIAQGGNRFHEAQFQFYLTPGQATDIASNRDIQAGSRIDYLHQIQLRFCPLPQGSEPTRDIADEFPPNLNVHVNGKMVQLPNPIPTNKPGVEPKRPPKPVNITPQCKLSPILPNTIGVKWAAEYTKGWVIAISLVTKLTSDDLLERLKRKGTREASFTKNLIIEKLNDDDADVATTSLKVSVTCPLGKMRMRVPCRPITCNHLQCFDAGTFLQMNERKPTWNCPVCDRKALYDDLLIDGYFQDILDSKKTANENDIILEQDGTWNLVPKEEDKKEAPAKAPAKEAPTTNGTSGAGTKKGATEEEPDCITLSDDEEVFPPSNPPLPPGGPPPLPAEAAPPPPPPPPGEIECIDID